MTTHPEVPFGSTTAKIPSPQSIAAILSPLEGQSTVVASRTSASKRPHVEAFSEADRNLALHSASSVGGRAGGAGEIKLAEHRAKFDEERSRGLYDESVERRATFSNKMRSSIACSRCRRSKIKCLNNGTDTTCRACATTGRECSYPVPAPGQQAAKRSEAPGSSRHDGEAEAKRQRKKDTEVARRHSLRHGDHPFESPVMTPKLWKNVHNAFMLHCSAELPFLHEEIFHNRVQQPVSEMSPDTQIVLLGMLTLTARYIPDLVMAHDPTDPVVASEYYADAFDARIDASVLTGPPSLDRLHGLLMMCLYHWGMCRGERGWMYATIAIAMARVMGLMYEEAPTATRQSLREDARHFDVQPKLDSGNTRSDEQIMIQREIKRRTAYSCFILDRYQASGRYRTQCIRTEDIHVQLPCSEEDFMFGTIVKTGSLMDVSSSLNGSEGSRPVASTQVQGIYIRLAEIWGNVSQWSCNGGRHEEVYPPWDGRSQFHKLRQQLETFHYYLPPKLTFSPTKVAAHIAGGTITLYTSIHTLYSLCTIVLHRENIPFIPLRCEKPSGLPNELDFPSEKVPTGFWEESANLLFKSARDIMELVRVASERQVLVESPQVAFAVWNAAFLGIYSVNFPHMDQGCYMCDLPPGHKERGSSGQWKGATSLAIKTLGDMGRRSKMAYGWSSWISRMHHYFESFRRDRDGAIFALSGPNSEHQRRLNYIKGKNSKESGYGDGLEEYRLLEKALNDLGPSLEQFQYDSPESRASTLSRASTKAPQVRTESPVADVRSTTSNSEGSWAAVNTIGIQNSGTGTTQEDSRVGGYQTRHSPLDESQHSTYPSRAPTSNPANSLAGSSRRNVPGELSSPYQREGSRGRPDGGSQLGRPDQDRGGITETINVLGQDRGHRPDQRPTKDMTLKSLEQINMHGVDVAAFGGGLDFAHWHESLQGIAGLDKHGSGGINFMEAVAGPSNMWQ